MAAKKAKQSEDQLAARHGMTGEQWRHAKVQHAAANSRGKRPAGTAEAETKLASWGAVEGQQQLFSCQPNGNHS
ncbi:hypothetical protein [Amycolatopsis panacis]|uniref:Uncharacterized protein n=1 Tax=Amycolatopsis panacis TaxID=2340917 RepID=A0A419IBT0_9PSEU|nr:hypothetical protein [Amycolatopsis panacis]RJQ92386.1 hypothetical protein D5S19_01075 [Amycolatopsis panacis]